jgi:tetratricopeptide (TPR) repeat protein
MIEIILIVIAIIVFRRQLQSLGGGAVTAASGLAAKPASAQLARLVEYADRLFAEKKWLSAEKAYLNVLKHDHKNVTAYTHLGIIYSTQKNYADAIECFQISTQLKPSGTTFQNLGLAFFENRNYMKSIAAFEKAIMFEPNAARYIALSKVYRKISNPAKVVEALEKAAAIDSSVRVLQQLADEYEAQGRPEQAQEVYQRIHALDPADDRAARKIGLTQPEALTAKP